MTAEILRRAAKVLREHAEAATPGPWEHVDYSDPPYQPLTSNGEKSTFMGCGSVITMGEYVEGGPIAAPNGDLYPRSGYSPKDDMALIALMHPPVALALATVLDGLATVIDGTVGDAAAESIFESELALARAILREPEATS